MEVSECLLWSEQEIKSPNNNLANQYYETNKNVLNIALPHVHTFHFDPPLQDNVIHILT